MGYRGSFPVNTAFDDLSESLECSASSFSFFGTVAGVFSFFDEFDLPPGAVELQRRKCRGKWCFEECAHEGTRPFSLIRPNVVDMVESKEDVAGVTRYLYSSDTMYIMLDANKQSTILQTHSIQALQIQSLRRVIPSGEHPAAYWLVSVCRLCKRLFRNMG